MKIMKCFLTAITIVFIILCFTIESFAVGNAATYKVTVQSVQLKNDAGNWVTIATPNQEIDIASAAAGVVAGSFMNDATIPPGNYVNFKIVLSETMTFSGSDGVNFTRSGGDVTITGDDAAAASTATWPGFPPNATPAESIESHQVAGPAGEVTVHLNLAGDADNYIEVYGRSDLTNPVTVTANSVVSMYFDFDTQNTVIHQLMGAPAFNVMFFTPPQAGTQFGITADGTSITITEAGMRIDF